MLSQKNYNPHRGESVPEKQELFLNLKSRKLVFQYDVQRLPTRKLGISSKGISFSISR